jgi:hypothetical protein
MYEKLKEYYRKYPWVLLGNKKNAPIMWVDANSIDLHYGTDRISCWTCNIFDKKGKRLIGYKTKEEIEYLYGY